MMQPQCKQFMQTGNKIIGSDWDCDFAILNICCTIGKKGQ